MALDLGKTNIAKSSSEGFEFEVIIPEVFESTGTYLTVRGSQAPEVRNFLKQKYNQEQAKALRNKNKKEEVPDLEEAEQFMIDNALVRLIGWRNMLENDVELPFNKENATRILTEHSWIRQLILDESDNLGNFVKK